jgi:hypothetical protein
MAHSPTMRPTAREIIETELLRLQLGESESIIGDEVRMSEIHPPKELPEGLPLEVIAYIRQLENQVIYLKSKLDKNI